MFMSMHINRSLLILSSDIKAKESGSSSHKFRKWMEADERL